MKKPAKILIVDDEPDILLLLRIDLEAEGYETLLAADGDTALRRIADERPDLVLLDVMMPVIDGWGVLQRLHDMGHPTRVVVVSAKAASTRDAAARRVLAAVEGWAAEGPLALPGTERRVGVEDALYATSALSMALDFDDYVCFGHTGHSAVLVPLLLAAETGTAG